VSISPSPNAMEHAEPRGVSWTKRWFSSTRWSWSTTKPTCSAYNALAQSTSDTGRTMSSIL
jgi:hypothetical protein